MPGKTKTIRSPRGLARLIWRAPVWFYRLGLGELLGGHFLLLNHTGRKSGKLRQAVLEVVRHDKETDAYLVASGFGEKADWVQNVMAQPDVTIQVRRRRMTARGERLPLPQATQEIYDYNRRHPTALRNLLKVIGYDMDGGEIDIHLLAGVIPILALIPVDKTQHTERVSR